MLDQVLSKIFKTGIAWAVANRGRCHFIHACERGLLIEIGALI
jgi:hypothetical protein